MGKTVDVSSNRIIVLMWALGALAIGGLVYVIDRHGEAWFLPSGLPYPQTLSVFGILGTVLPSMTHTFAFIVFSALVWASTRRQIYIVCILWVVIELVMETVQLPVITDTLMAWGWHDIALGQLLVTYSARGTFYGGDIIAIGIGAVSAGWLLRKHLQKETNHGEEMVSTSKV